MTKSVEELEEIAKRHCDQLVVEAGTIKELQILGNIINNTIQELATLKDIERMWENRNLLESIKKR